MSKSIIVTSADLGKMIDAHLGPMPAEAVMDALLKNHGHTTERPSAKEAAERELILKAYINVLPGLMKGGYDLGRGGWYKKK